jgi:hypothetical protein
LVPALWGLIIGLTVAAFLGGCCRRHRQIVWMREQGLSMSEIGRRLGISRQAVGDMLARIKEDDDLAIMPVTRAIGGQPAAPQGRRSRAKRAPPPHCLLGFDRPVLRKYRSYNNLNRA